MRTHINIDEILAMNPCPEFDVPRETFIQAWAGQESITLEAVVENNLPYFDFGMRKPKDDELLWVLVHLMTRRERLEFGLRVMNKAEELNNTPLLRTAIDVMIGFLREVPTHTARQVMEQEVIIETRLKFIYRTKGKDPGDYSPADRVKYQMVNATRQLMKPEHSRVSTMGLCRLLENHHPNATYKKFNNLAVKVLKEEI